MLEAAPLAYKVKILEQPGWDDEAACKRLPSHWFVPQRAILRAPEKEALEAGVFACQGCPVKEQCESYASPEDFMYTVRAGHYPTAIKKLDRGRPKKVPVSKAAPGPNRRVNGVCVNGHVVEEVGLTSLGRCLQCHREADARHRLKKGHLPTQAPFRPLYGPEELKCERGHDLTPANRSPRGQCLDCRRHEKKKNARERRRLEREGRGMIDA